MLIERQVSVVNTATYLLLMSLDDAWAKSAQGQGEPVTLVLTDVVSAAAVQSAGPLLICILSC